LSVRVRPGSSSPAVGGSYDDGSCLVVRVSQRAVDGKATEAALHAVAEAFSVPPRSVRLLSGARARTKVVEVAGDDASLARRLAELLALHPGPSPGPGTG
jgi:uncharacterized protein YggU (UPF0235/DUF167 family)